KLNISDAIGLLTRDTVRLAPLQLLASSSVSATVAFPPTSRVTKLPTPGQATSSPLRLPMLGELLIIATVWDEPLVNATGPALPAPSTILVDALRFSLIVPLPTIPLTVAVKLEPDPETLTM